MDRRPKGEKIERMVEERRGNRGSHTVERNAIVCNAGTVNRSVRITWNCWFIDQSRRYLAAETELTTNENCDKAGREIKAMLSMQLIRVDQGQVYWEWWILQ